MLTLVGRENLVWLLRQNLGGAGYQIGLDVTYQAASEKDVIWTDIVEATFDGYERKNFSFSETIGLNGSEVAFLETGVLRWEAGMSLMSPETIHGLFVLGPSPTSDKLYFYKKIVPGVDINMPEDFFETRVRLLGTNYAP